MRAGKTRKHFAQHPLPFPSPARRGISLLEAFNCVIIANHEVAPRASTRGENYRREVFLPQIAGRRVRARAVLEAPLESVEEKRQKGKRYRERESGLFA